MGRFKIYSPVSRQRQTLNKTCGFTHVRFEPSIRHQNRSASSTDLLRHTHTHRDPIRGTAVTLSRLRVHSCHQPLRLSSFSLLTRAPIFPPFDSGVRVPSPLVSLGLPIESVNNHLDDHQPRGALLKYSWTPTSSHVQGTQSGNQLCAYSALMEEACVGTRCSSFWMN